MGLNPFVVSNISTQPVGVPRASFGTPGLLSYNASAFGSARERLYASRDEVLADFPSITGPEYLWATAVFAQDDPVPERIAILRGALPPTMLYTGSVATLTPGETYPIRVRGDGATTTDISIALPLTDLTWTSADVTTGTDVIAMVAHGMTTGDGPYRVTTGGTLPTGTAIDTNYWIIAATVDTIKLASSYATSVITILTSGPTVNHF